MDTYRERIIKETKCSPEEAAGVEAYMRLDFSTLDGLSKERFAVWSRTMLHDVRADPKAAAALAKSYGLKVSP